MFVLQVIKCLELNEAKRVSQHEEWSFCHMHCGPEEILCDPQPSKPEDFSTCIAARNDLQNSSLQSVNFLHALRPAMNVLRPAIRSVQSPNLLFLVGYFQVFELGINRDLQNRLSTFFRQNFKGFNKEEQGKARREKKEEEIIDQSVLLFSFLWNSFILLISFVSQP